MKVFLMMSLFKVLDYFIGKGYGFKVIKREGM